MFRITETNREIAKVRVDELQFSGICLSKKSREIAYITIPCFTFPDFIEKLVQLQTSKNHELFLYFADFVKSKKLVKLQTSRFVYRVSIFRILWKNSSNYKSYGQRSTCYVFISRTFSQEILMSNYHGSFAGFFVFFVFGLFGFFRLRFRFRFLIFCHFDKMNLRSTSRKLF